MGGFPGSQSELARIYEVVKGSLEAEELPLGSPIPITVIAENLQVRAGPVRTVCRQLIEEGWAISADGPEILAWHQEDNHIASLYGLAEEIITAAIDMVSHGQFSDGDESGGVQRIHDELSKGMVNDQSIPQYTGELFFAIVARANVEHFNKLIRKCDEQLFFLRVLEDAALEGTGGELLELYKFFLNGRNQELKQGISKYFNRRCSLLPKLRGQLPV